MNEQQLENLLEEALQNVQENIPNMVQSFQQQPWISALSNLDISSQSIQQPVLNILQDLSGINVVTNDLSGNDLSLNHLQENTSIEQIEEPINTPPVLDQDQIQNMAMFNLASEYMENMSMFQQNMSNIVRALNPRLRNRNIPPFPSRLLRRDRTQPSFVTSFPNRMNRNTGQISMELLATPFAMREPDNLPQVPTLQQYTNATETFVFNSESVSRISSMTCPITLEDFQHGELLCEIKHCHHIFKESALRNWFVRNTQCPVCRYDIRSYFSTT